MTYKILTEESIAEMEINRLSSDVKIAYSPAEAEGLGYGYGEWIVQGQQRENRAIGLPVRDYLEAFPGLKMKKSTVLF